MSPDRRPFPAEVLEAARAWMQDQPEGFGSIALRTMMARRMPTWTHVALIDTASYLLVRAEQKAGRIRWDAGAQLWRAVPQS